MRAKKIIVTKIINASEGSDSPKWMFLLLIIIEKGVLSATRYMAQSAWKKTTYKPTTATVISRKAGHSLILA